VAGLRAELAALRANLEILFDADLSHRPAIENERTTVRAYSDWARDAETTGRVSSSRIDADDRYDGDERTEESPIIDVPAEPHPPEPEWVPSAAFGGAHRRPSEMEQEGRRRAHEPPRAWAPPPAAEPPPAPEPAPQQAPEPEFPSQPPQQEQPPKPPVPPPQTPRSEPEPVAAQNPSTSWQPAPAEGQWTPAGSPGSNWVSSAAPESSAQPATDNGSSGEYVGRRRSSESAVADSSTPPTIADSSARPTVSDSSARPTMSPPSPPPPSVRGRHSAAPETSDPGRPHTPPTLTTESAQPPPQPQPTPPPAPAQPRHRSAEDTGGQSVAELLARLQATPTGGGRRRRRDE
jgi:hypothetical protein